MSEFATICLALIFETTPLLLAVCKPSGCRSRASRPNRPPGNDVSRESLADGTLERAILFTTRSALVPAWDIDATRRYVSWTTRFGNTSTITTLSLGTWERAELEFAELEFKGTRADLLE